jgi:hypothetical protein
VIADKRRIMAELSRRSASAFQQSQTWDLRSDRGGPGWDRTSDLPRVKRTLSH